MVLYFFCNLIIIIYLLFDSIVLYFYAVPAATPEDPPGYSMADDDAVPADTPDDVFYLVYFILFY